MSLVSLVNSTDVSNWSDRRTSQDQLPKLLRRLIRATTERINFINVRADEGVQLKGFDGVLEVENGNEFVPEGKSVWEFGTNKQIKTKADADYEKRKKDLPDGIVPVETAYVFVTSRRYSKKEEWVRERQKEKFWREVKFYDADDLETWLESAPAVHLWLSVLLGKHPETAVDIENFWMDWTEVTNPSITSELVIAGRNQEVEKIHEWLNQPASALALRAESKSEAIAFFAATLHALPSEQKERALSVCLVAEEVSAWRQLSTMGENLILIPNFEGNETATRAVQKNHHVLIPLGKADAESSALEIPRLNRANAKQALVNIGISDKRAENLATLARRSFLALRRKIAINAAVQTPAWAKPSEARNLLPILLVGGLNDAYEKDREAVAGIAQTTYETVNDAFVRWANEPDPPLRRVGNTWLIASKEDSWALLARYLTRQDLETFENVVLEVLGEIDAQFELSPSERMYAGILVKNIPYSGLIREGIAETLAIMAARSNSTVWADAVSGQERVNRIVYELLRRANENWHLWASITYLLPLLAEAAPTIFLDAVEFGLTGETPVLLNMFSEAENSWTSNSPHTGLLWALEMLAWNADYLGHSAMILAKLTRLDPGGRLLNRPNRSLREIFLCWNPQTTASLDKRLQVIDAIRKREPEVAWQLLNALLPEFHSVGHPTSRPRWREWVSDAELGITNAEVWRAAVEIVARLLKDVGADGKRWSSLIARISDLPANEQDAIIEKLSSVKVEEFTAENLLKIWTTLREEISRHREYPTADWSMPSELTDRLEQIYNRFTPKDIISQYSWLFSHNRNLINPIPYTGDHSIHHLGDNRDIFRELRHEAVDKMFFVNGVTTLLEAASKAEEPGELGITLGQSELLENVEDDFLKDNLASSENSIAVFLRGFVTGRFNTKGWNWAVDKLSAETAKQWSASHRADYLICLPFYGQTWDIVDTSGEETKKLYWERVNGYPEVSDAERATRELINYNRPQATIEFLSFFTRKEELAVPTHLVIEVLTKLLTVAKETPLIWNSIGYRISTLFELLDKSEEIEETEIAKLEWAYMPVLENYGRGPKLLHRELGHNPEFFVEVASYIYRAEDEETRALSEYDETRANLAYKLIDSWHGCPGKSNEDGSFDAVFFHNWITQAREKFREKNRALIGDTLIGHILAFAPFGNDGTFPHEAVRDLIEEIANPKLEHGIEIQTFNNRGVTTRAIAAGGGQERAIAERYSDYAQRVGDRHPRTAAMLRRIADSYLSDARRQDLNAELEQDLWR